MEAEGEGVPGRSPSKEPPMEQEDEEEAELGLNAVLLLLLMARAPPTPPLPEHLPPPGNLAGPRKEESSPTVGVEASGDGVVARGGGGRAAGEAGLPPPPPVAPLWPWPSEPAASGSGGSLAALARPFQKAEALLRHHRLLLLRPGLRRLLPRSAAAASEQGGSSSSSSSGEEESDSEPEGTPSSSSCSRRLAAQQLAQVERSFAGLSRCLCVQEDPRTETFLGHLRPEEAEEEEVGRPPPAAAFSFHPARACLSRRGAALHALLQQRHRLRLARRFSRRLQAASAFVGRLQALAEEEEGRRPEEGAGAARLLGLCEELHTHTGHWEGLRRHLSSNSGPWPRAALLGQRPEAVVRHMKRALLCLALHAARLLEVCLEARLRGLARLHQEEEEEERGTLPPPTQHQLRPDLFQAVQLYNQAVSDRALRRAWTALPAESQAGGGARRGPPGGAPFTLERVSALLAGERGRLAGERLARLLLGRRGEESPPPPWEGPEESWFSGDAAQAPLSAELQALCREEEGALRDLLRDLVASSTDSLWLRVLRRPRTGMKPPEGTSRGAEPGGGLPTLKTLRWLDASFAETAAELHGQYCPLLWRVAASTLACRLERHPPLPAPSPSSPAALAASAAGAAALGQRLICTLAEGHLSCESTGELRALGLRLLLRDVFCHWDQGFCLALGSSITEKCTVKLGAQDTEAACSRTARCLQSLCRPLSFSLRCLDPPSSGSTGHHLLSASLRLKLLSLAVATSHTSCYWVMSKAHEYLASWSLSQFLLVTQGDLQVLKMETKKMWVLVGEAFPEKGGGREHPPLISGQEQELSQQVHTMTTSIHLFTEKVLGLFSLDCKRMSLEIFEQTMPLGKHWRLALRTELPTSPSEYASAAAQTVLGQVLQGLRLLPREAQGLALSIVTTAFLEAWMDHILAQKIKFSLQGALQLKQDFDLVRGLLQSEDSGLSLEIRQWVLSLRVFQQMDNAIACLLQQPGRASLPSNSWGAFHKCCSFNGLRTPLESGSSGPGSLNSLESLEGLPNQGGVGGVLESPVGDLLSRRHGGGCSPETYLSPTQQEWLALRLHGGHRWRVPTLPCMNRLSES